MAFLAVDPESTGQLGALLYAVYDGGDGLVAKWKESCSGSSDDNDNDINTDDDQAEKDASEYDEEQMQDHSRKHTTSESNYFLTNEVKTWLNNFQSSA
jgi:hypothetical protein